MSKNKNNFYYEQEIVALIKSGFVDEAKKIADSHLASGNYDKIIEHVADERKQKREDDEALQRY